MSLEVESMRVDWIGGDVKRETVSGLDQIVRIERVPGAGWDAISIQSQVVWRRSLHSGR